MEIQANNNEDPSIKSSKAWKHPLEFAPNPVEHDDWPSTQHEGGTFSPQSDGPLRPQHWSWNFLILNFVWNFKIYCNLQLFGWHRQLSVVQDLDHDCPTNFENLVFHSFSLHLWMQTQEWRKRLYRWSKVRGIQRTENKKNWYWKSFYLKFWIEITVVTMHCDSLIAPQHPKNEIKKMIAPRTMSAMGMWVGLLWIYI